MKIMKTYFSKLNTKFNHFYLKRFARYLHKEKNSKSSKYFLFQENHVTKVRVQLQHFVPQNFVFLFFY